VEFRTNRRVFVKSVLPSSLAAQYNIQPNYVVVKINGQSAERTNAKGVAQMIAQVKQSNAATLEFTFRDDSFQKQLQDLSNTKEVTTQLAPSGDTTQRNPDGSLKAGFSETYQGDQKITVTQLIPPKMCKRGADVDDLMEISYVGSILETGVIFDGSAVKINGEGIPGRGNDVSIFFVLGKQPFGQFPPGWDVGMSGMCVGERRRIVIPPVMAYGSTGVPRRNIPPDASLVYDVSLISINGLATPQ
jgi:FK506-binding protein 2